MTEEKQQAINSALEDMQKAFKTLTPEEIKVVRDLQREVDAAAKAGAVTDAKLEFCYSVKFSKDKISNEALINACEEYIKAAEG